MSRADTPAADKFWRKIFFLKADLPVPDQLLPELANKYQRFDLKLVEQIIKNCIKQEIRRITPVRQSTLHWVFLLEFDKKPSKTLKINVFNDFYKEYHFLLEKIVQQLLAFQKLPALQVELIDTSRISYPFDFLLMETAKGETFFTVLEKKPVWEVKLLENYGKLVAKIHQIKTSDFGHFQIGEIDQNQLIGLWQSWKKFLTLNLVRHLNICKKSGVITHNESLQIKQIFAKFINYKMNFTPVLVHGDLTLHNVFWDGDKISGLTDWEDALSGDPVYDLANLATFFALKNQYRWELFLHSYRQLAKLPSDFELRFWWYFLRISLAKTVHRNRFGYPDPKDLPPPATRIKIAVRNLNQII